MAVVDAKWDGTYFWLPDGRKLTQDDLTKLGGSIVEPSQPQAPQPLSAAQGVLESGEGETGTETFKVDPPPEVASALAAGKSPWDIAYSRRKSHMGDHELMVGMISPEEWMDRQTTVNQSEFMDEDASPERRLAAALLAYGDLAKNPDNEAYWLKRLPVAGAAFSTAEFAHVRNAVERMNDGEAETDDYLTIARFLREAQGQEDRGFWQGAADIMTMLPGFAVEFTMTGGASKAAGLAVRGAVRGAAEAGAKGVARKAAGKLAGSVARAGVQAALNPWRIAESAERRRLQGDDVPTAYAKGFVDMAIEYFSEAAVGEGITKGMSKAARKSKALDALRSWLSKSASWKALKKAGVQDPITESLEERFGEEARNFTIDPDTQTVREQLQEGHFQEAGKQLLQEFVSFMALPAGSKAASVATALVREKPAEAPPRAEPVYPPSEEGVAPHVAPEGAKADREKTFDEVYDEIFPTEETPAAPAEAPAETPQVEQETPEQVANREFLSSDPELTDRVASLPDKPTRTQFAEATGQPRMGVRQNAAQRAEMVSMARQLQSERPTEEAPKERSFLPILDLPEAQRAKLLKFPEARDRIKTELEGMTKWEIAKQFDIPKTGRNKVRSKNAMIDMILKDRVDPYQQQGKEVIPSAASEVQGEAQAQGRQVDVTPQQDSSAETGEVVADQSPSAAPPQPVLSEKAQEKADQLKTQYGDDVEALVTIAQVTGLTIPKKGTKARKELTAEQLRNDIAVAMTTVKQGTEIRPTQQEPTSTQEGETPAQPDRPSRGRKVARGAYGVRQGKLNKAKRAAEKSHGGGLEIRSFQEAETPAQEDAVEIAKTFGRTVVFVDANKDVAFPYENLIVISRSFDGGGLHQVLGHELAHSLGHDKARDLFGDDRLIQQLAIYTDYRSEVGREKYWQEIEVVDEKTGKKSKKTVPTEIGWREATADLIGNFWEDASFRNELIKTSPSTWKKIVDLILKAIGKVKELKDPAARRVLELLKADQRRYEQYRKTKGPGRPSKDQNDEFLLNFVVDQLVSSHEDSMGEAIEDRDSTIKEMVTEIKRKHEDAYHYPIQRNLARTLLRSLTGHNKSSIASSVENKGRDYTNMTDVKWDVHADSARAQYPDAFIENSDRGDDWAGIAYDLVRDGDEKVPSYHENIDLIHDVVRDYLYAEEPAQEFTTAAKRLEKARRKWTEEDESFYNDAVASLVKDYKASGFDYNADSDRIINEVLDEMDNPSRDEEVPFTERDVPFTERKTRMQKILDEKPELKRWFEKQRYLNRANPGQSMAERVAIWKMDVKNGPPEYVPHTVADIAARERIQKNYEGERDRVLKTIRENEHYPIPSDPRKLEEEAAIADELLRRVTLESLWGDKRAAKDAYDINKARRELRSWVARTLARRDPLFFGSPRDRRKAVLMRVLFDQPTAEDTQKILDRLKELGIELDNLESALEDEMTLLDLTHAIQGVRDNATNIDKLFEYYSNSLFGPLSIGANIASNAAMLLQVSGVERVVEAVVNDTVRATGLKIRGATLGELKYAYRGTLKGMIPAFHNLIRSWRWESSALAMDLGFESVESKWDTTTKYKAQYAIKGKKGELIRSMGWRPNIAFDDFFKTMFAYGHAAALAYRKGKSLNLERQDLENFIQSELQDQRSATWGLAYVAAMESTFSQDGNEITKQVKKAGQALRTGRLKLLSFPIPFMNFPINAAEAVLARVPIIGAIAPAISLLKNDTPRVSMSRVAARQISGYVAYMALASLANGSDDDGIPFITGSADVQYNYKGLQYRTAPPMSINIGGQFYSYARFEPFSTLTGIFVDAAREGKKGGKLAMFKSAVQSSGRQIVDKTYLQNVGDMIEAWNNPESAMGTNLMVNMATGFMPNWYRQTLRLKRNEIYDVGIKKSDTWGEVARKAATKAELPELGIWTSSQRKRDAWGRVLQSHNPSTSLLWRLTVPIATGIKKSERVPADIALAQWNEIHEGTDKKWAPGFPSKDMGKDQEKMTNAEYERFLERSGQLALERVSEIRFTDPPTAEQIEIIKRSFTVARKQAKAEIRAARGGAE